MTATHETAAAALAAKLPTKSLLTATPVAGGAPDADAPVVVANLVGPAPASFALYLDPAIAAEGAAADPVKLTPALEAGARSIGSGALTKAEIGDASLFAAAGSVVFELSADGKTQGWLAISVDADEVAAAAVGNVHRIANVEMNLTVEVGHTRMSVRDVLALEPGAVIELDRSAGAPADIKLNGRLLAHGEVVVIDQDYAVRITRILDKGDAIS